MCALAAGLFVKCSADVGVAVVFAADCKGVLFVFAKASKVVVPLLRDVSFGKTESNGSCVVGDGIGMQSTVPEMESKDFQINLRCYVDTSELP